VYTGADDGELHAPLPLQSSLARFIHFPSPPSKIPVMNEKASARVLTSCENMKLLEEKQKAKAEKSKKQRPKKSVSTGKTLFYT
jgi:hypothetical protein